MPGYIGNEPLLGLNSRDRFTGDGATTGFTLTRQPPSADGILVTVSGVVQDSNTYAVVGKTLTFQDAPPTAVTGQNTQNIEVTYLARIGAPYTANWNIPIIDNSGTVDAIVASFNPAITTLVDNLVVQVVMPGSNTVTVPTINTNGLGALPIVNQDGSALVAGQLSGTITLRYESSTTNWRLITSTTTPLAAYMDNSSRVASTSFVQRSSLQSNGTTTLTVGRALTVADAGKLLVLNSSTQTYTLPAANSVPAGTPFVFVNIHGTANNTISRASTDLIVPGVISTATITIKSGDTATLYSDGASLWFNGGGSAFNGLSRSFDSSLANAGYQKLPSGLILQWGGITIPLAGTTVSFPIAFPVACTSITVTPNAGAGSFVASTGLPTVTNFPCFVFTSSTGAASTCFVLWMAVGF